jgi:hypothetical protein
VPHPPRFRALALFGRRLPERVVGIVVPASENLRITRLPRCKKVGAMPVLVASAITATGGIDPFPYNRDRDRLSMTQPKG